MTDPRDETQAVVARYARRGPGSLYSPLRPEVWLGLQERQRALLQGLAARGCTDLSTLSVAEVGCGTGGNLLELLRLGADPARLTGLELLPERHAAAQRVLPPDTTLWLGDAVQVPETVLPIASQDLVLQSTVFSSLLDDAFQAKLAQAMWAWLKPGGAVIWYDFAFDNPRNADVQGMPMAEVRRLFPAATIDSRRVTLAPPLARSAARLHPVLPALLNTLPLLRTHRLAWIAKPDV